jgi:hypothetical protein
MSHNLVIAGIGCPWQTPTEVTRRLLEHLSPGTVLEQDLEVIERLRAWVHATHDPPPLAGRDARNPYLVEQRRRAIAETDEEIDSLIASIRQVHDGRRMTGTN